MSGEQNKRVSKNVAHAERPAVTFHIKNMVCDRCIMTVESLLRNNGYQIQDVLLGQATISPQPDTQEWKKLESALQSVGFEIARSRREEMVAVIKSELINYLNVTQQGEELPLISDYLSQKMHRSYPTLSRTFTASEGLSIEKYLIRLRIERVKELLNFGDMSLSEIAWNLGYNSVQHLSAQFKSVTGKSVSEYKAHKGFSRKKLDAIK